ncbi:MAG TPA: glycosyltransferase family 1 protein [Thermoanaerobaculia bacterium]|nr:glycosyltransferase family 1 protein [Thermoanaerobaculia bacterium]
MSGFPAVVQIVPRLPPPFEGVGSFAAGLAAALRDGPERPGSPGIASRLLAAGPGAPGAAAEAGALAARLEREAGTDPVLLHYVGYGYQPRGCPRWLVDGLAAWKAGGTGGRRRLVTLFHEVHASGPPWRSSFWLSPAQRRLAARLAALSDGRVTSLAHYRRLLRRRTPGLEVAVLPVFSTVGEPAAVPPLAARSRRLVVFGGPGGRARAYRRHAERLADACRALAIEEVWDVGPPGDAGPPAEVAGRPLRQLGELSAAEVSVLLAGSLAGFAAYPPRFLAKSTVFAAYCAHGMLPLCAPAPDWDGDETPPFWDPASAEDPQRAADRALAWYRGHAAGVHAALYRELLLP